MQSNIEILVVLRKEPADAEQLAYNWCPLRCSFAHGSADVTADLCSISGSLQLTVEATQLVGDLEGVGRDLDGGIPQRPYPHHCVLGLYDALHHAIPCRGDLSVALYAEVRLFGAGWCRGMHSASGTPHAAALQNLCTVRSKDSHEVALTVCIQQSGGRTQ